MMIAIRKLRILVESLCIRTLLSMENFHTGTGAGKQTASRLSLICAFQETFWVGRPASSVPPTMVSKKVAVQLTLTRSYQSTP